MPCSFQKIVDHLLQSSMQKLTLMRAMQCEQAQKYKDLENVMRFGKYIEGLISNLLLSQ